MKVLQVIGLLTVIAAVGYGGWWFVSRQSNTVPPPSQVFSSTPGQILKPPPLRVNQDFTVESRHQMTWTFAPPAGKTPGLLQGRWTSQGKSAGLRGANDDTLIAFKLLGPNDNIIQQQPDHPVGGNFSVRCEGPGNLTFVFDNGGIIRSSSRQVHIEGTYQAD
jgi:hypothetical protein